MVLRQATAWLMKGLSKQRKHLLNRSNIVLSPYHNNDSFQCEVNIANSPIM